MSREDYKFVKKQPPHDKSEWVKIIIKMKDKQTGEIKTLEGEEGIFDEETGDVSTFIWEDGNFSCKCNRDIFWGLEGHECGEPNHLVNIYSTNGKLIYGEFK